MISLESAVDYQKLTAYRRLGPLGGGMDWSNQPSLYKTYTDAEKEPLPRELSLPRTPVPPCFRGDLDRHTQPLTLAVLAKLLFMAYGFTSKVEHGPEVFLYRSAPSAGALYPVEVYVTARDVAGLPDGLYHYHLMDFSLVRLRSGTPPAHIPAPAVILTAMFYRSAWKYKKRAFRYCLLDTGHVAENFMLSGQALGLSPGFCSVFNDRSLAEYLGLDPSRERPLGLVQTAPEVEIPPAPADISSQTVPAALPLANQEIFDDLVLAVADKTAVPLAEDLPGIPAWAGSTPARIPPLPAADWADHSGPTLVQALQQRRSRRNFRPQTVLPADLARLVDLVITPDTGRSVNLGLVVSEVQDWPDGFYVYQPDSRTFRRHKPGFLNPPLATAALDQDWIGRANVTIALSAPLKTLEETIGPRALRLAYLAAGRIGQRAYLAAETLGWGCCGVGAFFDEDVAKVLGLPPGEDPLYLLSLGPIKKRTHGGRSTN